MSGAQTPAEGRGGNKATPLRAKIGLVLSGIAVLFLTMDAIGKLLRLGPVMSATTELGFPASSVLPIGLLLTVGIVLYAVPRTMLLGSVYLTGFLGGAVASHVRVESPLLTHTLFAVYVALFIWGGAILRNNALLSLLRDTRVS